jgi:hypothetical protein
VTRYVIHLLDCFIQQDNKCVAPGAGLIPTHRIFSKMQSQFSKGPSNLHTQISFCEEASITVNGARYISVSEKSNWFCGLNYCLGSIQFSLKPMKKLTHCKHTVCLVSELKLRPIFLYSV